MTITIKHHDAELTLTHDEAAAVHLADAMSIYTKPEIPELINTAAATIAALRDEWNRAELKERREADERLQIGDRVECTAEAEEGTIVGFEHDGQVAICDLDHGGTVKTPIEECLLLRTLGDDATPAPETTPIDQLRARQPKNFWTKMLADIQEHQRTSNEALIIRGQKNLGSQIHNAFIRQGGRAHFGGRFVTKAVDGGHAVWFEPFAPTAPATPAIADATKTA